MQAAAYEHCMQCVDAENGQFVDTCFTMDEAPHVGCINPQWGLGFVCIITGLTVVLIFVIFLIFFSVVLICPDSDKMS